MLIAVGIFEDGSIQAAELVIDRPGVAESDGVVARLDGLIEGERGPLEFLVVGDLRHGDLAIVP